MVGRFRVAQAVGLLVALVALVPPAFANHPQTGHGDVLVFDHKTGNEWWVEVVLSGGASGSVAGVQAMDTGGPWVALQKQTYGSWGASFHIEPGHQVMFRANWAGGEALDSCWFDHPSGVERCGGTTTSSSSSSSPSTSTTGGAFDATFTGVKGNAWWVQASVTANQPLAGVDARVNCAGSWHALAKQSYGWSASFNVPNGAKVDFRARASSGASDLSGGYVWPQATPASACSGTTTSSSSTSSGPPPFDATFTGVKGNHWWIQATVSGNQPITLVEARLDCEPDAWFALGKQSWGWAISTEVLDGQRVDFRATSSTGAKDLSGGYTWTAATPAPACPLSWPPPPTGFNARYSNLRGDRFHVTADVTASKPLATVEARTLNTLDWHPLTQTAPGTWSASFDVTGHNVLEFRATATDGSRHVTHQGWYWPYDGSYTTTPQPYPSPGPYDDVYWGVFRGDAHEAWVDTFSIYPLTKVEVSIDLSDPWYPMTMDPDSGDWHATGLNVPYGSKLWFRASYVLATGATGTDYEPGGEGPWPPWPQIGSYYEYREVGSSRGTDDETLVHYDSTSETVIVVRNPTGWYSEWNGTCTTTTHSFVTPPGQPGHWDNRTDQYDFSPDMYPNGYQPQQVGENAYLEYPSTCAMVRDDAIKVCERGPHQTRMLDSSRQPITVDAVRACSHFTDPPQDEDFWYDQRVGLLLDWHTRHGPSANSDWQSETTGWLVRTDAPLTGP
ncbi:MAG: hypothetical protein QOC71_1693 [Thermoplasmata archaeon]|nr:hypothetical protein [Thermoplasmata archaeon]